MARAKTHRHDRGIAAQLRPTAKSLIKEAECAPLFKGCRTGTTALTKLSKQLNEESNQVNPGR